MAVVVVALHHFLYFSRWNNFNSTSLHSPVLLSSRKKAHSFLISCSSSSSSTSQTPEANTETPEYCVNLGLELFSKGRVKDALVQFESALSLDPNAMEAQAALYNKACCHAYSNRKSDLQKLIQLKPGNISAIVSKTHQPLQW